MSGRAEATADGVDAQLVLDQELRTVEDEATTLRDHLPGAESDRRALVVAFVRHFG